MLRPEVEEKVKAAGGKVAGGVSGNTTYLVVGSRLDDGRQVEETSKYRKYMELKDKGKKAPELLDETKLLAMLPGVDTRCAAPVLPPKASAPSPPSRAGSAGVAGTGAAAPVPQWVDTYAPRGMQDLVGNGSVIKKLTEWLRDWDAVVLKGQKKQVPFRPGGGIPDNVNARAALISGPPGIGKTTSARLIVQLHGGYELLEYNASDARGHKVINEMAMGIADNTTISFSGGGCQAKVKGLTKRACIIMDEVDGIGGGDRGGNAALIRMIKKTRNPIICICNDSHSPKVRSLAFSCYDLKFQRPTKTMASQRCAAIAQREGLGIEPNALEALAESCGSDMRMILNQLQMLARSSAYQDTGVRYMDMKQRISENSKDIGVMMGPFDACKKLLNTSEAQRLSFRERLDMFFVDFSLVGLLVHENYLRSVEKKPVTPDGLRRCAYSADLMTVSDMLHKRISFDQEWSLLPDMGIVGAVYPSLMTNGFVRFPSFPQYLGKCSTMSRTKRLQHELQAHLRLTGGAGRDLVTSGYGELLYKRLVQPLVSGHPGGLEQTVATLDAYGLRKEHLQEHLTELRQYLGGEDLFKMVDPKVKAAMTREFNGGGHAMRVVLPASKRRKAEPEVVDPDEIDDGEVENHDDLDGEHEDDADMSSDLIKAKGKANAKDKAKAKAKAAGASASAADTEVSPGPAAKAKGKAKGKARPKR